MESLAGSGQAGEEQNLPKEGPGAHKDDDHDDQRKHGVKVVPGRKIRVRDPGTKARKPVLRPSQQEHLYFQSESQITAAVMRTTTLPRASASTSNGRGGGSDRSKRIYLIMTHFEI